jgi:iron complex outermembrane recepter protein
MGYFMKSVGYILYLLQLTLLLELIAIAPVKAEIAKNPKHSAFQKQSQRELSLSNEQSNSQISTSAGDLLAQQNTITRITGVEIEQTQKGLQIILKTVAGSQKLVPLILPEGNNLVIDILDATLAFAIRNGVTQTNPASGISEVTLTKIDNSSIRLTIKGEKNAPSAEVIPSQQNLVLSVTPEESTAEQTPDEEIEVIATGEAEENEYIEPNASTATRTDTPQRDIPQAIQVIPQQVIKDQGVTRIEDALRNAVGVTQQPDRRSPAGSYNIRGFSSRGLRNGFDFDQSGTGRQTLIISSE